MHTARVYRREAELLLLWSIIVRRKPLSSPNTLTFAYINGFPSDPQPAGRWIGQGKAERFDPARRPFTKLLPEISREIARKLLSAMCGWLLR